MDLPSSIMRETSRMKSSSSQREKFNKSGVQNSESILMKSRQQFEPLNKSNPPKMTSKNLSALLAPVGLGPPISNPKLSALLQDERKPHAFKVFSKFQTNLLSKRQNTERKTEDITTISLETDNLCIQKNRIVEQTEPPVTKKKEPKLPVNNLEVGELAPIIADNRADYDRPVEIIIVNQIRGNNPISKLRLNLEDYVYTLTDRPYLNFVDIQNEPIGKYTVNGKLPLQMKKKPIKLMIHKDTILLSTSYEEQDRLMGQCISQYVQMFNVIVKQGKNEGLQLDKYTHSKPISQFAENYELSLLLSQKKFLISHNTNQSVYVLNKETIEFDKIKFESLIQVEKKTGDKFQMKLEEDVENLMSNVASIIQNQTGSDSMKTLLESYERSVQKIDKIRSKQVEENLKKQTYKQLPHHPIYILGESAKNDLGVEVTYSENETAASVFSILRLSTLFGSNYGKGVYKVDEGEYKFDQIMKDWVKRNQFIVSFKKEMANYYGVSQDKILVQNISRGSINVEFYYEKAAAPEYSKSKEPHLKGRLIKEENLFKYLNLCVQHFDSKGDIDFVKDHVAGQEIRGRLPYYQPSGWIRYGLNVKKWIVQGDSQWLAMNGNDQEWSVAFHGVKTDLPQAIRSIADTTLKPGHQNYCHADTPLIPKGLANVLNAKAKRENRNPDEVMREYLGRSSLSYTGKNGCPVNTNFLENQVGEGVYVSPLISVCEKGTYCGNATVNGESFIVAFQCRVRPESIRICQNSVYWVIRNPEDIRPYGLLISKRSELSKQQHQDLHNKFEQSYAEWGEWASTNPPNEATN